VQGFENSAGFFSVSGVCDPAAAEPDFGASILSLFPSLDVNAMLAPRGGEESALVIIKSLERVNGGVRHVVSAFEPSLPADVARWAGTRTGHRPADYAAYKAARAERMRRRIVRQSPAYEGRLRLLDTASVLTFRDYLNSPDGCAYGIKQKIGQFNLFGKLPVRNFYAAGQSAVLPGLVGAMMSAFIVNRAMLGREAFGRLMGAAHS
jgi:all-trans-retinol 13,14-reductase